MSDRSKRMTRRCTSVLLGAGLALTGLRPTQAGAPPTRSRNVALGAIMTSAVSVEGSESVVTLVVTSEKARKIRILGVGASEDHARRDIALEPGQPQEFRVKGQKPKWWVAIVDPEQTRVSVENVYGPPGPAASVSARVLDEYTFLPSFNGGRFHPDGGLETRAFVAELFQKLDESFFVYATKDLDCAPKAGEPLLLEESNARTRRFKLRAANGDRHECFGPIAELLSTTRPSRVVMPEPAPYRVHETSNLWQDEEFFSLADRNPRIAQYIGKKKAASQCFDETWNKLDPDGTANRYDLVSFDGSGNVKKVEGYADKLQRKVDSKCKLDKLMKERAEIRKGIEGQWKKDGTALLKEIEARFSSGSQNSSQNP